MSNENKVAETVFIWATWQNDRFEAQLDVYFSKRFINQIRCKIWLRMKEVILKAIVVNKSKTNLRNFKVLRKKWGMVRKDQWKKQIEWVATGCKDI